MMAPFIVKVLEHKTALGAFLPGQVRTKSVNEARETDEGSIGETTLIGLGQKSLQTRPTPRSLTHTHPSRNKRKKPLKQIPSFQTKSTFI